MELKLLNTNVGLVPLYDDDLDEKKKLRLGETYAAKISVVRNLAFHNKYMKLVSVAWQYLTEKQQAFFNNNPYGFRKSIEIASGFYEPYYSLERKEWVQAPKSVSFGSMSQDEFTELYDRVFDTLMQTAFKDMDRNEFERVLSRF